MALRTMFESDRSERERGSDGTEANPSTGRVEEHGPETPLARRWLASRCSSCIFCQGDGRCWAGPAAAGGDPARPQVVALDGLGYRQGLPACGAYEHDPVRDGREWVADESVVRD